VNSSYFYGTVAGAQKLGASMKKYFFAIMLILITLPLVGCGGGSSSSSPPPITTQILSDPIYDGDISLDSTGTLGTPTQAVNTQNVFAGIDPINGTEFRAFLDFFLSGQGGVPSNAGIVSATLDIRIDSISLLSQTDTIPIRIDLVSFQPPTLISSYFINSGQALALATITTSIFPTDLGQFVRIDVTSLMMEAQRLNLPDFQVRISENTSIVGTPPGLFVINDATGPNAAETAPLLEVTYF
jgi:hypothetical protein